MVKDGIMSRRLALQGAFVIGLVAVAPRAWARKDGAAKLGERLVAEHGAALAHVLISEERLRLATVRREGLAALNVLSASDHRSGKVIRVCGVQFARIEAAFFVVAAQAAGLHACTDAGSA